MRRVLKLPQEVLPAAAPLAAAACASLAAAEGRSAVQELYCRQPRRFRVTQKVGSGGPSRDSKAAAGWAGAAPGWASGMEDKEDAAAEAAVGLSL